MDMIIGHDFQPEDIGAIQEQKDREEEQRMSVQAIRIDMIC
jgi:hypothetical protein